MVAVADNLLGVGLYSLEELAFYARVSNRLVNRWFFGTNESEKTVIPHFIGEESFVPFLDFVQMMAIRELRQGPHRVSLKKIRQLIEIANEQDIAHPFAKKGITFLWGNELGFKLPDGRLVEASGPHRRNTLLKKVVVLYKEDLQYDASGMANLYRAFTWRKEKIVMNPKVRFGEPIVTSCGYSAQALWEAAISEGTINSAAKAYGVTNEAIEAACRYYDHLKGDKSA